MVSIDRWWNDLTRDRFEAILELVIDAIADDYEDLEMILTTINEWYPAEPELKDWKALKEVPVSRFEVVKALRELTQEGYAQAYIYDAKASQFQAVDFREDKVRELWMYATPKGIRAVRRLSERDTEKA